MASTDKQNRAALLEDFTGVRCGFCPDGHVLAKSAKVNLGANKFIIMAVHSGTFAVPQSGWANFTTPFNEAIDAQAKVSGYPAGSVSRILADSLGVTPQRDGSAMSRNAWETAARAVNMMAAPLNLGAKAITNGNDLTVEVDMYYTSNVTAEHKLNVALIQDGLVSNQSGGGPNYVQDNVLRDLITGQWGEVITEPSDSADFVRKSYTYTLPADYNGTNTEGGGAVVKEDLKVVIFVTKGNQEVYNVIEVDVD